MCRHAALGPDQATTTMVLHRIEYLQRAQTVIQADLAPQRRLRRLNGVTNDAATSWTDAGVRSDSSPVWQLGSPGVHDFLENRIHLCCRSVCRLCLADGIGARIANLRQEPAGSPAGIRAQHSLSVSANSVEI
jgi:hypothetical protein